MPSAVYNQIVASLQTRQQTLREPLRLPAEVDLAAEHQVSRDTIRRALRVMEKAGAVTRKRGQGTYLQPIDVRPTNAEGMHVGLVPPWWADSHGAWEMGDVLEGVTRWADDHDCRLSIIHADAAPKDIESWTRGVHRRRLTGLIWAHPQAMQIPLLEHTSQWLPTVILGRPILPGPHHCVMPDYGQAAGLIDDHLVNLGHRCYSMVQVDHTSPYSVAWIQAIEAAQNARGQQLNKRSHLIDFKGFDRSAIPEMLLNHYKLLGNEIQALVLPNASHLQAFVAHDRFRQKMATDLSIVAFDYGKYRMDAYWPGKRFTHVACPWREVGRQAMAMLSLIVEGKPAPKAIRVPVQLVTGDTSFPFLEPRTVVGSAHQATP